MGWFSRFKQKFVDPVVDAVVEIVVEPIVEVATSVVETVYEVVVEPVVDAVTSAVAFLTDSALSFADTVSTAVIEYAPAVAYDAILSFVNTAYDDDDINVDQFKPVAPESEQVQHRTITDDVWTVEETNMVRDAVALSQVGYADLSDLIAADTGAVDLDGYVIDQGAVFDFYDWNEGEEDWLDSQFEIIRIQEAEIELVYEANVTLLQSYETQEYFVSIGGTASIADAITDAALVFFGTTFSQFAISDIIADFFENDIAEDATVNLVGESLGGAEALLQYQSAPDLFDEVFLVNSAGLGGFEGTYYDQNMWDGTGDANITEITGDDDGTDFNDLVTSLGHIGAGQTYYVEEIVQAAGNDDNEFIDSHMNDNFWASLPGGENPELPLTDSSADVFEFV